MSMWKVLFCVALVIAGIAAFPGAYTAIRKEWSPLLYPDPQMARGELINKAGGQVANRAQSQFDSKGAKTDDDLMKSAEAAAERMRQAADWQYKMKTQPQGDVEVSSSPILPAPPPKRASGTPASAEPAKAPAPFIAELPIYSCDNISPLRSSDSASSPSHIRFFNRTDRHLRLIWVTPEVQLKDVGDLPGQSNNDVKTFVGHTLGIADDRGACLGLIPVRTMGEIGINIDEAYLSGEHINPHFKKKKKGRP
jgi:hypothetical protein